MHASHANFTYTATLTLSNATVYAGSVETISLSVTRNGITYNNFIVNVTRDTDLTWQNITTFTNTDNLPAPCHTYRNGIRQFQVSKLDVQ